MPRRSLAPWRQIARPHAARSLPRPVRRSLTLGLVTALITLLCLAPATATSRNLYVFGDSLSDTGNVYNQIGRPTRPYVDGRFSNGLVWVDRLAQQFQLTLTPVTRVSTAEFASSINFAFGGATTGSSNNTDALPGLQQQVELFREQIAGESLNPDAIYLVWAGANDYLGGRFSSPSEPIANLKAAIDSLIEAGARRLVIGNLPSLGQLPATRNRDDAAALDRLAATHNQQIAALVEEFGQRDGVEVRLLDVNSLFARAIAGEFNFINVTEACFNAQTATTCANPDGYLFWDGIHPSATAHRYISDAALPLIESMLPLSRPAARSRISQPVWIVAAVGLAGLGAIGVQQRKRRSIRS